jgi:hypothetical protein
MNPANSDVLNLIDSVLGTIADTIDDGEFP